MWAQWTSATNPFPVHPGVGAFVRQFLHCVHIQSIIISSLHHGAGRNRTWTCFSHFSLSAFVIRSPFPLRFHRWHTTKHSNLDRTLPFIWTQGACLSHIAWNHHILTAKPFFFCLKTPFFKFSLSQRIQGYSTTHVSFGFLLHLFNRIYVFHPFTYSFSIDINSQAAADTFLACSWNHG